MTAKQIQIATEQYSDQLWRLNNLYWIIDKSGKKILFQMNSSQLSLYNELWYRNVILKARQRGFTTFLCLYALDMCLFNKTYAAGIIAHNLKDAEKIFRTKVKYGYDNLPQGIKSLVSANNDRTNEYVFNNDSNISVSTSYRSGTLQFLHVSEMGKIAAKQPEKAREIRTGAFEAVSQTGIIVIESTAEGNAGEYFDIVEQARRLKDEGETLTNLDFKFIFEPWFDNPDYNLDGDVVISEEMDRYFKSLEDEGIHLTLTQKNWYIVKERMQDDDMRREYPSTPSEAFEVAIDGAYYSRQMRDMRIAGNITTLPVLAGIPVNTFWDIGMNDTTAIWFHQRVGEWDHFIDYYERANEDFDHFAQVLFQDKSYMYGTHYVPHDSRKRSQQNKGMRDIEYLEEIGFRPIERVDRIPDVMEGIRQTKAFLPGCKIDKLKCADGIKALDNYRKEWDDKHGVFRTRPLHNDASNGADAFRQAAQGYDPNKGHYVKPTVNRAYKGRR